MCIVIHAWESMQKDMGEGLHLRPRPALPTAKKQDNWREKNRIKCPHGWNEEDLLPGTLFLKSHIKKEQHFFSFQSVHLIAVGQDQLWVACSVLTHRNASSPKSPDPTTPSSLPLSSRKAGGGKSLISQPSSCPLLKSLPPIPGNWTLRRLSNIRAPSDCRDPFPDSWAVWPVGDRWVICLGEMHESTHSHTIAYSVGRVCWWLWYVFFRFFT